MSVRIRLKKATKQKNNFISNSKKINFQYDKISSDRSVEYICKIKTLTAILL